MAHGLMELVAVLGGEAALGPRSIRRDRDLHALICEGLPITALDHAITVLGCAERIVIEGIGISRRSLQTRRAGERGRLNCVESERIVRLGRIAVLGRKALGSMTAAGRWLQFPNRALGGVQPISLLQTDVGAREVEDVLTRAALGGYS